ncbi:MAG: S-methyl-5-thioribose-1-phosphate isomerase [Candidatus Bathyarchaeota archaeon]|nr:S-methyl-5-thioribose-1-phosphate isomerase [Candidatus Bathyarchaeota archaeon]
MKVKIDGETRDVKTLWREDSTVWMIDQRKLPHKFEIISLKNHKETAKAIKTMVTRGAGAIGCAAGFGMAQAALEAKDLPFHEFMEYLNNAAETIKTTRPTAVNLFKAVDRCLVAAGWGDKEYRLERLIKEADNIANEDLKASLAMGESGARLIEDGFRILTHCNAGALAFTDHGTALSPIRYAHREGKKVFVWVDETRPRCQGSRLTAWEMQQEGIPYSVIVDNAAGYYMRRGEVDMVIVGADRVTANGDVVNKIGTYEKAVLAYENNIPFYVAAPGMTFDLETPTGDDVEIEERDSEEVTMMWGVDEAGEPTRVMITREGTIARNPAFDVTPAKYITAFITDRGIIKPPYREGISWTFG